MLEKTVWTEYLSEAKARKVARALKAAGYKSATIGKCREYVINVAQYFEPGDASARDGVIRIICKAAGIQPQRE